MGSLLKLVTSLGGIYLKAQAWWVTPLMWLVKLWWMVPIAIALWYGYNWSYERGAASRNPEIVALKAEKKAMQDQVDDLNARIKRQQDAFTLATNGLKAELATVRTDLTKKLDDAERRAKIVRVKEVPVYVTAKADAACTVPVGFVRLHNESADHYPAQPTAPLPGSGPPDVDAPSGVALSTIASTVRDNYAECNARWEVIEAWQSWYGKAKGAYDRASAIINASPDFAPSP
jgi:hypothetical protein